VKLSCIKYKIVYRILEKNNFDKSRLISILQAVQKEYKYLPEEILFFIASSLSISPAKIYGVATFFTHFTLQPKGKHIIKVCDGTACHIKKSINLIDVLRNKLEAKGKNCLIKENIFTVETVSCLGACGLAPVLIIDYDVYGQVTPDKVISLIDVILEQEMVKK
jgi:NADH-quinone oxidoreductase subunit E